MGFKLTPTPVELPKFNFDNDPIGDYLSGKAGLFDDYIRYEKTLNFQWTKIVQEELEEIRAFNSASEYRMRRLDAMDGYIEISSNQIAELYRKQGGKCYYCDIYCTKTKERKLTMDHVVPISRGGKHHIDNIRLACKSCNSKKRDNLLSELGNDWWG